jgi:hypothetical protein
MKRRLLVTGLIIVLVGSAVAIKPCLGLKSDVKVGLFYYVWYTGKPGEDHWNGSLPWTVVDEPLLGYYNSSNSTVIKQHLEWFRELNINFLIISWWGPPGLGGNVFNEDSATREVFNVINETGSNVKVTLMVEGFNMSGNYDFKAIYDYISTNYLDVYPNEFFELNGKPLVCWWNDDNMTGPNGQPNNTNIQQILNDSRFEARIIGHDDYVNWTAWRPNSLPGQNNSNVLPVLSVDGFTCIEPRYDDTHINGTNAIDPNYSLGMYDNQWNWAISNSGVKIIAIYSWNEYHERSQIEPHIAPDGEYVLLPYAETYHYIQIMTVSEFSTFLFLPPLLVTTLLAVTIYKRKSKTKTGQE